MNQWWKSTNRKHACTVGRLMRVAGGSPPLPLGSIRNYTMVLLPGTGWSRSYWPRVHSNCGAEPRTFVPAPKALQPANPEPCKSSKLASYYRKHRQWGMTAKSELHERYLELPGSCDFEFSEFTETHPVTLQMQGSDKKHVAPDYGSSLCASGFIYCSTA